jgi:alpha-L-rhamnosidase
MKRLISILAASILTVCLSAQNPVVTGLTTEHKINPVGIGTLHPRFSWKIDAQARNTVQTAFSAEVSTDGNFNKSSLVWQTGKVNSGQSVLITYEGKPLVSSTKYFVRVKIWDNRGKESAWSTVSNFETGLLKTSDWVAKWIELPGDTNRYAPSPHFRKEFSITKPVAAARVYITSHGFYELHLNGNKVGDQVLTPGWTSYGKRLQYQVYDITASLKQGSNAVGAVLGDGWYRSTLGWGNNWAVYGKRLGLLLQIRVKFTDGTETVIVTDDSWKGFQDGAIRMSDIYNGETYDATKRLNGWSMPGYDQSKWLKTQTSYYDNSLIIASEGAAVKKIEEITPVSIFRTPKGSLVADMGQNMVGWIRLKVKGPKGTVVTLRHAEVLDKYGEFYTTNLRSAKCRIDYTLAGSETETYEPRFTFMGFRYVEITGFPGELKPENLTGIVVHSDMKPTGTYTSSNKLINQLQHNIVWGMKGNFVDVPTDCPQRDERLGWTGDAQVFCRTAAFNMDVAAFFTKWLKDVSADQRPGGEVPDVIPDILNRQGSQTIAPSAAWGDIAVITPWTMYLVYGDKRLLETQYPSMKAWVEYIRKKAGESYIWKGGSKYGDWLFYKPHMYSHTEPDGHTEPDFIATAMYAYSSKLLSLAAAELGKVEDEKTYADIFNKIKEVFNREYVTPAGRVGTNSQTSYVLALMFDLLPENVRKNAAAFLVSDIKSRRNHLATGFVGTSYLCHVLSSFGYTDVAYDLLLQETYPSWLYPVKMGATTIWERWDGQKTDSTFQDPGMNSFNHYAYGAIGDWMYRVSAGIEAAQPGYKKLIINPNPGSKLEYSKATLETQYGQVISGWERKNGKITVTVRIPVNTTATVMLPSADISKVTEGGKQLAAVKEITDVKTVNGKTVFEAGSGEYIFEISGQ